MVGTKRTTHQVGYTVGNRCHVAAAANDKVRSHSLRRPGLGGVERHANHPHTTNRLDDRPIQQVLSKDLARWVVGKRGQNLDLPTGVDPNVPQAPRVAPACSHLRGEILRQDADTWHCAVRSKSERLFYRRFTMTSTEDAEAQRILAGNQRRERELMAKGFYTLQQTCQPVRASWTGRALLHACGLARAAGTTV